MEQVSTHGKSYWESIHFQKKIIFIVIYAV